MKADQTFGALPAAGERLSSLERIKQRKVFIAVPIMFSIDPHFFTCAMKLQNEMEKWGIHGCFKHNVGDSAVGRSRNFLTRKFLESDCTHMLMIDSDLVFSGEHIKRLMDCSEPIAAGMYFKKQEGDPQPVINGLSVVPEERKDSLWEVAYAGTGFIRIAREVFEKMIEVYGKDISYSCDHEPHITEYDFWAMGPYQYPDGKRRWLSEDWLFCQRARDIGYRIYVDRAVVLKHSGNALYPLSYQIPSIFGSNPQSVSDCAPVQ